jgi:hypothetical protein
VAGEVTGQRGEVWIRAVGGEDLGVVGAPIARRRSRSSARDTTAARLRCSPWATTESTNSTSSSGSRTAICLVIPSWYRTGMHLALASIFDDARFWRSLRDDLERARGLGPAHALSRRGAPAPAVSGSFNGSARR